MKKYLAGLLFVIIAVAGFGCSQNPEKSVQKNKKSEVIHTVFKNISETGEVPTNVDQVQADADKDLAREEDSDKNTDADINAHVVLPPLPSTPSPLKTASFENPVEVSLLGCDSLTGWSLDTNHIGTGSIDHGAIKYVRTVDKKRNLSSTLRYKSPSVIDFTDKKLLKFDYKWSNPSNQLTLILIDKNGKSLTSHLVGKDVEPNVWHSALVPLVGVELKDIDRIDFVNGGDSYVGSKDGEQITLWIDNIRYIKPPEKKIFDKNIVIQFDDGYQDNYTNALPIFKKYNKVATVGMVAGFIGKQMDGKDMLTGDQLRALQSSGWEIASHTFSHKSMETPDESSINFQMGDSLNALKDLGLDVKHLIYPFTKFGPTSRKMSPQYYESASIGTPPNQNLVNGLETIYGFPDRHVLNRTAIATVTKLDSVKYWIEDAIRYQTFLIVYFHEINEKGGANTWTAANLEELLKWLQENNIYTLTTTDAIQYFGIK